MDETASYPQKLWRWIRTRDRRGTDTILDLFASDVCVWLALTLLVVGVIGTWGWHRAGQELHAKHPDTQAQVAQRATQWLQQLGTPAQGAVTCETLAGLFEWYWLCTAGVGGRPLRVLCDATHCHTEAPPSDDLVVVPWIIPVGK